MSSTSTRRPRGGRAAATRSTDHAPDHAPDQALDRASERAPGRAVTAVRVVFGLFWAIDAAFKWAPGFRHGYLDDLRGAAQGQPSWLHGWFSFWVHLTSGHATAAATATAVVETLLALTVLLGLARRVSYPLGALFALLIWGVGEGFGGPYGSGSTDIGSAVVYALVYAALLAAAPRGSADAGSLDAVLVRRLPGWRALSDVGGRRR